MGGPDAPEGSAKSRAGQPHGQSQAEARITAIVPSFGYSRADTRPSQRAPVTGRIVADLLEAGRLDRRLTVASVAPPIARAVRRCLAGESAGEEGTGHDSQSVS
jgi:phosphoribosylpyrophosphate synthetase